MNVFKKCCGNAEEAETGLGTQGGEQAREKVS